MFAWCTNDAFYAKMHNSKFWTEIFRLGISLNSPGERIAYDERIVIKIHKANTTPYGPHIYAYYNICDVRPLAMIIR